MTRRSGSEKIAEMLRREPPAGEDDVGRARMERRLLDALREGRTIESEPRSERPRVSLVVSRRSSARRWILAGGSIAAAAAIVLLMVQRPWDEPAARFVIDSDRGRATGAIAAGDLLEVGAGERAVLELGGASITAEASSRVRLISVVQASDGAESAYQRVARIALERGGISVVYHPRHRGGEQLAIETPAARVEVVGTVFAVRAAQETTHVSVYEGVVRVVPRETPEAAVLVRAGEAIAVRAEGIVAAAPDVPSTTTSEPRLPAEPSAVAIEPEVPESDVETAPEGASSESARAMREPAARASSASGDSERRRDPDPRSELATARTLLEQDAHERARTILVELIRAAPRDVRIEAHTLLAESLAATGALGEAADAYRRAADLGRGSAGGDNALFALARLYDRLLDDREAARRTYLEYLGGGRGAHAELARRAVCRLGGDPSLDCAAPRAGDSSGADARGE